MGCYDWVHFEDVIAQTKDFEQSFNHYYLENDHLYHSNFSVPKDYLKDRIDWSGVLEFYNETDHWFAWINHGLILNVVKRNPPLDP